jgi:hypothetical protein
MTATLTLTPLSSDECIALLLLLTKTENSSSTNYHVPVEELERARSTITLQLCTKPQPIIDVDGTETIKQEDPTLKYAVKYEDGSMAALVTLGRQKGTGIVWKLISRAICDVSLSDKASSVVATMRMRKPPNTQVQDGQLVRNSHSVFLDGNLVKAPLGGELPLANGSIIALYGPTGFAYQVHIIDNDTNDAAAGAKRQRTNPAEEVPIAKEKNGPLTERERICQSACNVMKDEYKCALCFDILVKSTFAYPCSHAFCKDFSVGLTNAAAGAAAAVAPSSPSSMTADVTVSSTSVVGTMLTIATCKVGTCPTCMGDVLSWMPTRSYDTQVWSFALQGCFERSDAEEYLKRLLKAGVDAPTEEERRSILNSVGKEE